MIVTRQSLKQLQRSLRHLSPLDGVRHLTAKAQAVFRQGEHLSATVQEAEQMVFVRQHDVAQGGELKFPGIWLRDNCMCDQCFHKDSLSRKPLRWSNFDCDVKVEHIAVDEDANAVHIDWSDKHQSSFSLEWLKERNFSKESQQKYINAWYRPKPKCWSKQEFSKILKTFEYKDIMENDEGVRRNGIA